jgi:hypothetical protein
VREKEENHNMKNKIEITPELFFAKCAKLNIPAEVVLNDQYLKK